ncbi:MAG: hypothetical protein ACT7A5_06905 [Ferrovibrionaceae bacterium]
MSMLHRIPLDDESKWNEAVRDIGWPAHSNSYHRALANAPGSAVSLLDFRYGNGRLVVPAVERTDGRGRDLVTPYGVGGMIVRDPSPELFAHFGARLREEGYVAGYFQLEIGTPWGAWQQGLDIRGDNEVFVLDLADEALDLQRPISENLREKLRAWDSAGARLETAIDRLKPAFLSLFPATMARVGASRIYDFAPQSLADLLDSDETRIFGGAVDGVIEAVSVFRRWGSRADYLFNASTPVGRALSAKLLVIAALQFKADGVELFCLGGGVRRNDGLAQFKRRFGGVARPLRALCQVYDRESFDRLCIQNKCIGHGSWFPPYRAPGVGRQV